MSTLAAPQAHDRAGVATAPVGVRRPGGARIAVVVLVVFAAIPLTFLQNRVLGFQMSGWSWLAVAAVIAPFALTEPLSPRAVRLLAPYLLFLLVGAASLGWGREVGTGFVRSAQLLVQLAVPALAYLVGWPLPWDVVTRRRLERIAWLGLVIAAGLTLVTRGATVEPLGLQLSTRPMSIALVVLLVAATVAVPAARAHRAAVTAGLAALAVAVGSQSRMATAVLLLLLCVSPALRGPGRPGREPRPLGWRGRAALALLILLVVVAVSQTRAFRERFFFDDDATLLDMITLDESVNTAGRRELWPALLEVCSESPWTGLGVGASYGLSASLSDGGITHPHNEYLRTYCDVGLIGALPVWAFFAWAAVRSWRGVFRGPVPLLHGAAGQLVLALLAFAITDNPLAYTAHLMVPVMVVLGLSDRHLHAG